MESDLVTTKEEYEVYEFIDFLERISTIEPFDLKEDDELIEEFSEELEGLYHKYLKHFYSDISIYCLKKTDDDIEYIIQNLYLINKANYKGNARDELRINIAKIIDHIRLIQFRDAEFSEKLNKSISESFNSYYKKISKAINQTLEEAKQKTIIANRNLTEVSSELEKTDEKIDDLDGRLRSINIDIIAVLSIFSAIIISFFGGLGFIGQALAAMNNANPKLTIIIITISGIVMFNIIYFLFLLIGKVIRVPIGFECKEKNCSDCDDNCNRLVSIWKRHFIFVSVNFILIMIIITIWLKLPGMFVTKSYIK